MDNFIDLETSSGFMHSVLDVWMQWKHNKLPSLQKDKSTIFYNIDTHPTLFFLFSFLSSFPFFLHSFSLFFSSLTNLSPVQFFFVCVCQPIWITILLYKLYNRIIISFFLSWFSGNPIELWFRCCNFYNTTKSRFCWTANYASNNLKKNSLFS